MSRSSKLSNRLERIFLIYRYLLLNYSKNDVSAELKRSKIFTSAEEEAIYQIIESIDEYISLLKQKLTANWSWERLNYLEQAILINGVAEIKTFINNKAIVINDSVNISKKYCQEKAHKLVNGILDKF